MTNQRVAEATKLRREGLTYRKIGKIMEISCSTAYAILNPKVKEYNKLYRQNHKEQKRLSNARFRKKNKDKIRACNVRYRQNNKGKIRLHSAEYYQNHKEKMCIYRTKYHQSHKNEDRAYNSMRRALIVGVTMGNLIEIKEIYRRAREDPKIRCYICGKLIKLDHRHVDHIVPLSKRGQHRASNLAVACDSCNLTKCSKMPEEMGILL